MNEPNPQSAIEWSGWPLSDAKGDPSRTGAGFLYVIEFSDGLIKVGQSQRVATRIVEYHRTALWRETPIVRVFISRPHHNYGDTEKALIGYCESFGTPKIANEYFLGLEFADVVRRLRRLPMKLRPLHELQEKERERGERVTALQSVRHARAIQERRKIFASGMKHAAELIETLSARVIAGGGSVDAPWLISTLLLASDCFSDECLHSEGEEGHAYTRDEEKRELFEQALNEIQPLLWAVPR